MVNKDWFNVLDFVEVKDGFYKGLKGTLMHYDEENDIYALDVNDQMRVYLKWGVFEKCELPTPTPEPEMADITPEPDLGDSIGIGSVEEVETLEGEVK